MRKPTRKAFLAFQQKADERLESVKYSFEALLTTIENVDRAGFAKAAENFAITTKSLREILPAEDWPGWLNQLHNAAVNYTNRKDDIKFIRRLTESVNKNQSSAMAFDWAYDPDEVGFPDVPSILEEQVSEKCIDEKFQEVIDILVVIIQDPDLDHDRAHADLTTIISMIKSAKNGGYADKIFTWNFARRFVPNLLVEITKSTPGIAQCVKAFEKTAEELDVSFDQIKDDISGRFYQEVERTFLTSVDPKIMNIPLLTDQSHKD